MPEKDIRFTDLKTIDLSTLLRSNGHLLEAHRLAVKHVLALWEDTANDDPKEHHWF